jgi:hypothetical protein
MSARALKMLNLKGQKPSVGTYLPIVEKYRKVKRPSGAFRVQLTRGDSPNSSKWCQAGEVTAECAKAGRDPIYNWVCGQRLQYGERAVAKSGTGPAQDCGDNLSAKCGLVS